MLRIVDPSHGATLLFQSIAAVPNRNSASRRGTSDTLKRHLNRGIWLFALIVLRAYALSDGGESIMSEVIESDRKAKLLEIGE